MARKNKKKGSQSKPSQLHPPKPIYTKEDEHGTIGERHSHNTQDWTNGPTVKIVRDDVNPKQTPSFATETKDKNATNQKQSELKHHFAQPLTLTSEVTLDNSLSQSFTSNSDLSLPTECTTSMDSLHIDNASHSCCETEESVDPQHLVLDRPRSIACMCTSPPTILGTIGVLPPEIQEMVFQNLSWESARNLAATNKYYQCLTNLDNYGGRTDWVKFLRSQEDKPKYNSYKKGKSQFACTGCWRLKFEKRFSIKQITFGYRKGGKSWRSRRCLACEIMEGRYEASTAVTNGVGKTMRLCKACGEFRSGFHCGRCNLCVSCMGDVVEVNCPRCDEFLWYWEW